MSIPQITRHWALAGAVAALIALPALGVRAQDAAPMAPAADTLSGGMTGNMSGNMSSETLPTNFSLLNNPLFDWVDIQQAKASGLSDNQVATIIKIAEKTGEPFRKISSAVQRGETFASLASAYNLRLGDLYDTETGKQELADYSTLYNYETSLSHPGSGSMSESTM